MIILDASSLGTSVSLPVPVECAHCKRMTMVIVHNPIKPGFICSCCAGRKS